MIRRVSRLHGYAYGDFISCFLLNVSLSIRLQRAGSTAARMWSGAWTRLFAISSMQSLEVFGSRSSRVPLTVVWSRLDTTARLSPLQKWRQRWRESTSNDDTAPTWAVKPLLGQISVISGDLECRHGGSGETPDCGSCGITWLNQPFASRIASGSAGRFTLPATPCCPASDPTDARSEASNSDFARTPLTSRSLRTAWARRNRAGPTSPGQSSSALSRTRIRGTSPDVRAAASIVRLSTLALTIFLARHPRRPNIQDDARYHQSGNPLRQHGHRLRLTVPLNDRDDSQHPSTHQGRTAARMAAPAETREEGTAAGSCASTRRACGLGSE